MNTDEEMKAEIDGMSYRAMLHRVRFGPLGDPMFLGEIGEYFMAKMKERRGEVGDAVHVATSKAIGW